MGSQGKGFELKSAAFFQNVHAMISSILHGPIRLNQVIILAQFYMIFLALLTLSFNSPARLGHS